MTPSEVLRAARSLIADEKNWGKNATIDYYSEHTRYCMLGALQSGASSLESNADSLLAAGHRFLSRALAGKAYVTQFNDAPSTTHSDVLAVFDKAIELAEQAEKAG
jgi:hypothetical protein